jgi:hypothetical protein
MYYTLMNESFLYYFILIDWRCGVKRKVQRIALIML